MFSSHQVMQRRLLIIAGSGVLAFFLIILALVIFSESLIRYVIERQEASLGRAITIGAIDINWRLRHTAVTAEDIQVGNAPDYSPPNMISIDKLFFTVKPLKLLVGDLEFGEVIVDNPEINLERKAEDDANWIFSQAAPANGDEIVQDRHDFPVIKVLELKGGRLLFQDAVKNLTLDLDLDWAFGRSSTVREDGFTISGSGTIQDEAFELEASGASLEALQDSTKDFPLTAKLVMGNTEISVDGKFRDPIKLTGVDATLNITGANMADLFYLTSVPLPPTPPYSLSGQLTKSGNTWGYETFSGKVDGSDLSGDFFYETGHERPRVRAALTSNVLDSDDLGGFIGLPVAGENATPEQQQAAAEKEASENLIPDVPLAVERLRAADLDISLNAHKIAAPNLPFKGMDVHFDLQDGLLKLGLKEIVLADGALDGNIVVDARDDIPPITMELNLRQLQLRQFFMDTRFADTTEGVLGGRVSLQGAGASLAEVLSVSNGKLTVVMADGTISLLLIEAIDLDIGEALPIFLGNDEATRIRCGVVDFAVNEGLLTSNILVLDTDDSRVSGKMKINMKDETIDAQLSAEPKDNSVFSVQTPITVSGRLKQPSIGIDAAQAGARTLGAIALGTLLTPIASVLAFADTGDAEDENCSALINSAAAE